VVSSLDVGRGDDDNKATPVEIGTRKDLRIGRNPDRNRKYPGTSSSLI
jgi:hypothetical protein